MHPQKPIGFEERFWEKVEKTNGCWLWKAARYRGYGIIKSQNKRGTELAHRASWRLHFGPIPDGMNVCHHCDTPSCIRPDHLFLGDAAKNQLDSRIKGRAKNPPHKQGESHGAAKFCEQDVREIRQANASGRSIRSLAKQHRVAFNAVWSIINRKTWAHI